MPLKRTPTKSKNAETDFEGSADCGSDSNLTDGSRNNNPQRVKRKRTSELQEFMEQMRGLFTSFTQEQNSKLQVLQSSINDVKSQNSDMQSAMELFSAQYDELQLEIETLRQERKENLTYIKQLENKIENMERGMCTAKIEIRQVPKIQNETKEELCKTVQCLGAALNLHIQTCDIKDIYRGAAKPNMEKPIIVEFCSVLTKENFIRTTKKLSNKEKGEKLNTVSLRLPGPSRTIYISESLTARGKRLYFLARDFAKSNGYLYCWTSYGKVLLRKKEGEPLVRINDEADLRKLKEGPPA